MKFTKEIEKFLKGPNFLVLGTLNKSGTIQMSPVWYEFDGKVFRFSTVSARVKYNNLIRDARCTFVIYDNKNPYRYVQVQGKVSKFTRKGGHDFIDKLAKHYMGKDKYPYDPERKEERVTFTITPSHFFAFGF